MLVTHGPPVLHGGARELARALDAGPWNYRHGGPVSLLTTIPAELLGHGITPAQETAAFAVSLDVTEPWAAG